MKVVIAASPQDTQVIRWLSAALGTRHHFHFLPGIDFLETPFHFELESLARRSEGQLRLVRPPAGLHRAVGRKLVHRVKPGLWQSGWFMCMTKLLQPDLVHAMQLEHIGHQCARLVPGAIPLCLKAASGELHAMRHSEYQVPRLREIIRRASFYVSDSVIDSTTLESLGFNGQVLGPITAMQDESSFDPGRIRALRIQPPSRCRTLAIQDAGASARSHLVLDALLPIRELASRFDIVVYSASEEIRLHAHVLRRDHGLTIRTVAPQASNTDILKLLASARSVVSICIRNASRTDLVEAMAAGPLPIRDDRAFAEEWVGDSAGALFVDPRRPREITTALQRALLDDAFVDAAAARNWQTCHERFDVRTQVANVHALYDDLESALRHRRRLERPQHRSSPAREARR